MSSTSHISTTTLVQPGSQADFLRVALTRREVKNIWDDRRKNGGVTNVGSLVLTRDSRSAGVVVTAFERWQFSMNRDFPGQYSTQFQVSDWLDHKKPCKAHRDADIYEEEWTHPNLAIKLAPASQQRPPDIDNPDYALSNTLKVKVSTSPADMPDMFEATMNGQDTSKFEVMLHIEEVESVPQELTPAMQRELGDARGKLGMNHTAIVPVYFTNGTNAFFYPVRLLLSAVKDARDGLRLK